MIEIKRYGTINQLEQIKRSIKGLFVVRSGWVVVKESIKLSKYDNGLDEC